MRKDQAFHDTSRRNLDEGVRFALSLADRHPGVRAAYQRLWVVRQKTPLLRAARVPGGYSRLGYNAALYTLALHHADWLRPPEEWEPPAANPRPLFSSLCRHLFARYPVPEFMTNVWLDPSLVAAVHPEHGWYKHLGRGDAVRRAPDLPVRLTRAASHHFPAAPDHLTARQALRRAQVVGYGGSEEAALAVAATRLGREFGDEDFWAAALKFVARHPDLDPDAVGPVVDFLHHRVVEPKAEFSFKGRTAGSLLRLVDAWHRQLGRHRPPPKLTWPRSRYAEFRLADGEAVWTLTELTDGRQLFEEGQHMRHCVASYARACARGFTSIWSLQLDAGAGPRRVLTVEVSLSDALVCQVRGRNNRRPRDGELAILREWAGREGLRVAERL